MLRSDMLQGRGCPKTFATVCITALFGVDASLQQAMPSMPAGVHECFIFIMASAALGGHVHTLEVRSVPSSSLCRFACYCRNYYADDADWTLRRGHLVDADGRIFSLPLHLCCLWRFTGLLEGLSAHA
jgi:hypothetical protein